MKKFLRIDLERILHSKRLYISLGIGTLIVLVHFMFVTHPFRRWSEWLTALLKTPDMAKYQIIGSMYPIPWYSEWTGGECFSLPSTAFFMLIPVLAVLPYGDSITNDHVSGYVKNVFFRENRKKYYQSKLLCSFLVGGITVCIPLLIDIYLCTMVRPSIPLMPEASNTYIDFGQMFSKLYYTHSCIYMMMYLCIIFVYSGLFSALGTGLGIFSTNRFIPLIFPFVVYLFEGTVAGALQYPQWAIENFLIPAQRVNGITFPIVLIEAVILLLVCVGMYVYGANHDETL